MKRNTVTRLVWLSILMVVLMACGGVGEELAQDGPGDAVEQVFAAYQDGNGDAINGLMSEQGQANAAALCSGAAINCLQSNYPADKTGELESQEIEVVEENEHTATVRLRTVWSERGEKCQDFQLDSTDEGWRITFFSSPRNCPRDTGSRNSQPSSFLI